MAEPRLFLCGGLRSADVPRRWRRTEQLTLEIGGGEDVHLELNQLTQRMRARIPEVATDLLELAAYVFAADQAVTRGGTSEFDYGDAWRRPLRLAVPVRRPDVWNKHDVKSALVVALQFLTDDEYEFEFVHASDPARPDIYLTDTVQPKGTEFAEVVLFSGGLDSLCGAVEEVLVRKRPVVLVSHRSSTRVDGRQRVLFDALSRRVRQARYAPLHVGMTINKGKELTRDFTQRTRSFVFASVAAVVARQIGLSRIRFYENGVTSLNLPVSPELVGARASRTTHPQSLARFGHLFSLLFGKDFVVENPYQWFTKADILTRLREFGHADLCALTCSCGHVWGIPEDRPHCGRCSQCVDRRVSALAAGLSDSDDPPGRYESDPLTGERVGPDLTFAERYVGSAREIDRIDSLRAFAARYPEINDALPYLGGRTGESAESIFALYQRHARGVCRAIQSVLQSRVGDLYWQAFPARSLLGVTLGRQTHPLNTFAAGVDPPDRGFVVDRDHFEVRHKGHRCRLGNTLEFRFLERLDRARGVYLSIETLGEDVWEDRGVSKNTVQAVASNLRRCLRTDGMDAVVIDGSQKGHYGLILPST